MVRTDTVLKFFKFLGKLCLEPKDASVSVKRVLGEGNSDRIVIPVQPCTSLLSRLVGQVRTKCKTFLYFGKMCGPIIGRLLP